jgi:PBP1b-binding outer membrane lipoprotein LpoB
MKIVFIFLAVFLTFTGCSIQTAESQSKQENKAHKKDFVKSENLTFQPNWKNENVNLVVFVQGKIQKMCLPSEK